MSMHTFQRCILTINALLLAGVMGVMAGCDNIEASRQTIVTEEVDLTPVLEQLESMTDQLTALDTRIEALELAISQSGENADSLAMEMTTLRKEYQELSALMHDIAGSVSSEEIHAKLLEATAVAVLVSEGLRQPGPAIDPREQRKIEAMFDAIRRFDGEFQAGEQVLRPSELMLDLAVRYRRLGDVVFTAQQFVDKLSRRDEHGRELVVLYPAGGKRPLNHFLKEALVQQGDR